jgi:hypothetical protein
MDFFGAIPGYYELLALQNLCNTLGTVHWYVYVFCEFNFTTKNSPGDIGKKRKRKKKGEEKKLVGTSSLLPWWTFDGSEHPFGKLLPFWEPLFLFCSDGLGFEVCGTIKQDTLNSNFLQNSCQNFFTGGGLFKYFSFSTLFSFLFIFSAYLLLSLLQASNQELVKNLFSEKLLEE